MNKMSIVMEAIWIVLSILCLVLGIYATVKSGFNTSYTFFVLAALAILMYLLRRYRRKKHPVNSDSQS